MGDRDNRDRKDDDDTKLFVGNITYGTSKKDLEDVFQKFGRVLEVRIAEEPGGGGRSRGYAFVTMEDPKDASDAVRDGSGVIVDGREIKVEVATGVRGTGTRGGNSGACYDFQRGQCSRGSSCKFSHDGEDRNGGGGGGRDRDSRDDRGGRDNGRDRDRDRDRDSSRRDDRGRDSDRRDDRRDDRRGGSDSHRESGRDKGSDRGSERGRERSRDRENGRDRDSDRRDSRRERDRSRDDDRSSRRDSDRR